MDEKTPATETDNSWNLTTIISAAIKIPGVKVNRSDFLRDQFKKASPQMMETILEKGPIAAGCSRSELKRMAQKIVKIRTSISTGTSFLAGIPGGIAMAATIPADLIQFYAISLRMAQELVYLYGEEDIWCDGAPDPDKVTNQLILYCGVMLGASGAAQAVRVMSSALAKQAAKKIPQMTLMKTWYYPIVKSILKFFGVSVTKASFGKVISKVVPVVGGVVSGSITFASMYPMGSRLSKTLDQAHFEYTTSDLQADLRDISRIQADFDADELAAHNNESSQNSPSAENEIPTINQDDTLQQIEKANQLLANGIITEEEYVEIKAKLISKM